MLFEMPHVFRYVVQAICAKKNTESGKIEYKYETYHNDSPPYGDKFQIWGHSKMSIFRPWRPYLFRHYRISDFWLYLNN